MKRAGSAWKVLKDRFRLGSLIGLTVVWIMLWGTFSWGTLVMGLVMSSLVLIFFPLPRTVSKFRIRPLALLWLIMHFIGSLITASVVVGWMAIRPRGVSRGRVLTIPLHETDDFRRTLIGELTSLVPGTVVIDIEPNANTLMIHIIDHCDDERVKLEVSRIYATERRVARAFGAPLDQTHEWSAA